MANILTATEFEAFEQAFEIAIRNTWHAIASDVMDSECFDDSLDSIVEITLDADHVQTYGDMTHKDQIAWIKFYRNSNLYDIRQQLARSALKGYA